MRVRLARPLVCAGAVCVLLVWLTERQAKAKVFNLALEYSVASGCPTAAEFKAIVAGRLGYDPFVEGMPDRVLVWIAPRGGPSGGRLEWRDATGGWVGEQTFPSVTTDCARFARVVGFALAVQIQLLANVRADPAAAVAPPEVPAPPSEPAPERSLTPPPPPPPPPPSPEEPTVVAPAQPPSPPAARPAFSVGVGSALGFGMSSSPVLLGRVLGGIAWSHLSIELAAEVSASSVTRREDGAGFSQRHLLLAAAGCAGGAPWNACVVAKGGEVWMDGRDIDRPASATAHVFEAGLRLGAVRRLAERVFLTAHVDGLTALSRWTARLDEVPVWTAPRFAATVGVDAVVRFP